MNHPAELAIHRYLENATKGETQMSESTIDRIGEEIKDALKRQFAGGNKRGDFRLRMSNIGRPSCQLWFEKNRPETALPKPTTFVMMMMIGDIVESVFKGLLTEAKIEYKDNAEVELQLDENTTIKGTYDIVIDDALDDIKSASDWSYKYKFESFETLKAGDSFGYIGQLAGYAKASGHKVGGWWVVNKANGQFKYVSASNMEMEQELDNIRATIAAANAKEFKRCFEPEPEYFRKIPTGNMVLNKNCTFCDYRNSCWETLRELPAQMSQAKEPKMTQYIKLRGET
jgi:hypothetical protein|tara:strand:+ start:2288 stop:3145 length:858 start_codon:yes stop_codon:yes gene_type:complete